MRSEGHGSLMVSNRATCYPPSAFESLHIDIVCSDHDPIRCVHVYLVDMRQLMGRAQGSLLSFVKKHSWQLQV
jgi:hypothetical protein